MGLLLLQDVPREAHADEFIQGAAQLNTSKNPGASAPHLIQWREGERGYLAMSGQLLDATIVAAPKQRNNDGEKAAIKAREIPEDWKAKPAKIHQKDRDARWMIKYSKAKPREDGQSQVDLAVPSFGYKNHISADWTHGLIRKWLVTDAAAYDGARLPDLFDKTNTASGV